MLLNSSNRLPSAGIFSGLRQRGHIGQIIQPGMVRELPDTMVHAKEFNSIQTGPHVVPIVTVQNVNSPDVAQGTHVIFPGQSSSNTIDTRKIVSVQQLPVQSNPSVVNPGFGSFQPVGNVNSPVQLNPNPHPNLIDNVRATSDSVNSNTIPMNHATGARARINDILSNLNDIVIDLGPSGQQPVDIGQQMPLVNPQLTPKVTNSNPHDNIPHGHVSSGQGRIGTTKAPVKIHEDSVNKVDDACNRRACDQTNNCHGDGEYCFFEPVCAKKTCQKL